VEERRTEATDFAYYLEGYSSFGIEAGLLTGKRFLSGYFRYGKSISDSFIEEEGGLNGEIELPQYVLIGGTFKYQLTKLKDTHRLVFNSGLRTSVFYSRYSGVQSFDDRSSPTYSRLEDFTLNLLGLESGFYLEVGRTPIGKTGLFFNFEPLYFRVATEGFGMGSFKTSLKLTF
jgi:hypothetical protein